MNMKKSIILSLLIVVIFNAVLTAQNPLSSPKRHKAEETEKSIKYPVFIQGILSRINNLQIILNKNMTELFNDMKKNKSKKAFLLVLLVAFLYGVLHAAGPGHGKIIIASYFISKKSKIMEGAIAGATVGFIHALSAAVLVMTFYFIIKASTLMDFENISKIIKPVSALLISGVGIFLLFKAIRKKFAGGSIKIPENREVNDKKNLLTLAFSIGIVPCPGVIIILLFSINKDILPAGLIAIAFMSLGMAVTISLSAILTIYIRNYFSGLIQKKPGVFDMIEFIIRVFGSVLIVIFGILLFAVNV